MPVTMFQTAEGKRIYQIDTEDARLGEPGSTFRLYGYAALEDGRFRLYASHVEYTPSNPQDALLSTRSIAPLTKTPAAMQAARWALLMELAHAITHPDIRLADELGVMEIAPVNLQKSVSGLGLLERESYLKDLEAGLRELDKLEEEKNR